MSTTPYHHGNLREALVDAATEVARDQGPDGMALRDLARRVGVSHNAAYRHFADRDHLLRAVAERGMSELMAAMQRLAARVEAPDATLRARRRLAAIGRGYVEYALAQPGLFKVTFGSYPDEVEMGVTATRKGPGDGDPDVDADPYLLLNVVLDELVEVGFLRPEVRPGADVMCWSTVHGFAVLHLDGPLRSATLAEREAELVQVLTSIDRAFGSPGDPDLFEAAVVDGEVNAR